VTVGVVRAAPTVPGSTAARRSGRWISCVLATLLDASGRLGRLRTTSMAQTLVGVAETCMRATGLRLWSSEALKLIIHVRKTERRGIDSGVSHGAPQTAMRIEMTTIWWVP
jgi:hypothetical protein